MHKNLISFTISTLSDKSQDQLITALYSILQKFEKTDVIQHNIYTWYDEYNSKPLIFNEDGTLKKEKYEIGNITTDVL